MTVGRKIVKSITLVALISLLVLLYIGLQGSTSLPHLLASHLPR